MIDNQEIACLRQHLRKASGSPSNSASGANPRPTSDCTPMELSLNVEGQAATPSTGSRDAVPWAVGVVNTLGATRPLLEQTYAQGPDQLPGVAASSKTPTAYSPENHQIDIHDKGLEKADALHQVVFELCNATLRDRYLQLDKDAAAGGLDCISYCVLKETLEYVAETRHDEWVQAILVEYQQLNRGDKKPLGAIPGLQELLYRLAGNRLAPALKVQVNSGRTGGYFVPCESSSTPPRSRRRRAARRRRCWPGSCRRQRRMLHRRPTWRSTVSTSPAGESAEAARAVGYLQAPRSTSRQRSSSTSRSAPCRPSRDDLARCPRRSPPLRQRNPSSAMRSCRSRDPR